MSEIIRSYVIDGNFSHHEYRNSDGALHREDGPAKEYDNGDYKWYQNGIKHRLDGPAIIYADGDFEWFVAGFRHRIDGPAVEQHSCQYYGWFLWGARVSFNDWCFRLNKSNEEIAFLRLKYNV